MHVTIIAGVQSLLVNMNAYFPSNGMRSLSHNINAPFLCMQLLFTNINVGFDCPVAGSGIFISPKGAARGGGSVAMTLILWGVGGIISMMGKYCKFTDVCEGFIWRISRPSLNRKNKYSTNIIHVPR